MDGDAALLQRYAETRDADAFAELARRHAGLVYGACLRLLRNRDEAEDAAQECFLKLAQHAGSIRGSLAGWLHAVARNQAIRTIRKDSTRRAYEVESMAESNRSDSAQWQEISAELDAALAELPDDVREVMILHYLEGLKDYEIAARLGVSPATISRRGKRGLDMLRAALRNRGIATSAAALSVVLANHALCAAPPTLVAALGKMAIAGIAPIGAGTAAAAALAGETAMKTTSLGMTVAKTKAAVVWGLIAAGLVPVGVIGILQARADKSPAPAAAIARPAPVNAAPANPGAQPTPIIVAQAPQPTPAPSPTPAAQASPLTAPLGGDDRYLIHVSTDKPIYRLGESVYVRAVMVNVFTRAAFVYPTQATVEIVSPRGDSVAKEIARIENGSLGYSWPIGPDTAGGDYKVKISSDNFPGSLGFPPAEREFNIRAFRQPRLRSQIDFVREGYGAGDAVEAAITVSRAEGGFPAGAAVEAIARVDEQEVWRGSTTLNPYGYTMVGFNLPAEIREGLGTLAFTITDGGVVETAAKSIPILTTSVNLQAYPEGGELVPSVENRLYFEAIAPNGRPADVTVALVDQSGAEVARAATVHEGRGALRFTPAAGGAYRLRVVDPPSVRAETAALHAGGAIGLRAARDQFIAGEPIAMEVASPTEGRVSISVRERVVAEARIPQTTNGGWRRVEIPVPAEHSGVLRVTAYDAAGMPRAERLVYRQPAGKLNIALELDRDSYIPGGQVRLNVRTTDERGNPAAGVVGLTVTNDATLELIERREQAPRLPVQVYLEPEVRELADARVYLSDDPNAPQYVDLLLGTQGWRRFAFVDEQKVAEFIEQHGDAARRVTGYREIPIITTWAIDGGGGPPEPRRLFRLRNLGALNDREAEGWFEAPADQAQQIENGPDTGVGPVINDFRTPIISSGPPDTFDNFFVFPDALNLQSDATDGSAENLPPRPGALAGEPLVDELQAGVIAGDIDGDGDLVQHDLAKNLGELEIKEEKAAANEAMLQAGLFRRNGRQGGFGQFADKPMEPSMLFRVYAHAARPDRQPDDRIDFTETLYFNAGLATNQDGYTSVTFDLSDAVTTFRAQCDAFSPAGSFGSNDTLIESRRPFYIETKAPLAVTAGDAIELPLAMVNETDAAIVATVSVATSQGLVIAPLPGPVTIPPRSRSRVVLTGRAMNLTGMNDLKVSVDGGGFADRIVRQVLVEPQGFPVAVRFGGLLEKDASHEFAIPDSLTGGLAASVRVYPAPLGNLTSALEALIRDPNGCFEQTSSTNYPLVMAMQYFQTHTGVDPALVSTSREKLNAGYKRLTGYESKSLGFEWFGGDPGHEALTAYGFMQFNDMSKIAPVDDTMLQRTRQWLLDRRDGKGGYLRSDRALDSFGRAPQPITDAYITWALAAAGETSITRELDATLQAAQASKDPYLIALAAGALLHAGRAADAKPLLARLASLQTDEGSITGAETSITSSGGESLLIETTSLAVLAWLADGGFTPNVENAMKWLCTACEGGRFGSTQSTVLALKAILAYDQARARPTADGRLTLMLDGRELETIPFTKDEQEGIAFKDFAAGLTPGRHTIALRMEGGSPMPYSVAIEYHAAQPEDSLDCPLQVETRLTRAEIAEGEPVEVVARIRNTADKGLPMTMLIVGFPGGLEVRHEQLQEAVKAGQFAFYEIRGRDVALYFRDFAPGAEKEIQLSALANAPGAYTAPATRAYLYYTPEQKRWTPGLQIKIAPRP